MTRILISALFIFFLPGYTMINALYPAKGQLDEKLDILYRFSYGVGLSVAIVIILGFSLGNIPLGGGDQGYFVGRNIWLGLVSTTIVFFLIGWYRGAYQSLSILSDSLSRPEPTVDKLKGIDKRKVKELQEVAKKRSAIKEKIRSADIEEIKKEEKELEDVKKRLKELEKEREDEL